MIWFPYISKSGGGRGGSEVTPDFDFIVVYNGNVQGDDLEDDNGNLIEVDDGN